MKSWFAVITLFGLAWAIPTLNLYDQLAPTLDQVRALQNSNPARALELLSKAEDDFRKGAGELAPVLREGIQQSLADARQALARRSKADLEARIQIIKAILGKALYDSYFSALAAGNSAEANRLLPKVLSASSLPASLQAQAQTLAAANNLDGLRRLFERTYAQGIANALQRAQAQTSTVQAYLEVIRAYALYLVVQDSPRARGLSAKAFVDALSKLSSGNLSGFRADVQALAAEAQNFLKAVSNPQSQQPRSPAATQTPPAAGGVRLTTPRTPPALKEVVSPTAPPASTQPTLVQDAYQQLLGDLRFLIKDERQLERVADSLTGAGIYSVDDWKRALLEVRGRLMEAQAQAESGQTDTARRTLVQVHARYRTAIAPLIEALQPELALRTSRLLELAENAVGLRTSDFTVLSGELLENSLALEGRSLGAFHDLQVWLLQTILGIPRAFVFILAGLLAFFPLPAAPYLWGAQHLLALFGPGLLLPAAAGHDGGAFLHRFHFVRPTLWPAALPECSDQPLHSAKPAGPVVLGPDGVSGGNFRHHWPAWHRGSVWLVAKPAYPCAAKP